MISIGGLFSDHMSQTSGHSALSFLKAAVEDTSEVFRCYFAVSLNFSMAGILLCMPSTGCLIH